MKRWLLIFLAGIVAALSAPSNPQVTREAISDLERKFDHRIQSYSIDDPFHLLGATRGVYLEDYGIVFTSELNLVAAAVVTPFRPKFTKEQVEALRQKKLQRLADLRKMMRAMMVDTALDLTVLAPEQSVAIGVSLFRFSWEDSHGIPSQVLMEARRQNLLDYETGKLEGAALDAVIRVREF